MQHPSPVGRNSSYPIRRPHDSRNGHSPRHLHHENHFPLFFSFLLWAAEQALGIHLTTHLAGCVDPGGRVSLLCLEHLGERVGIKEVCMRETSANKSILWVTSEVWSPWQVVDCFCHQLASCEAGSSETQGRSVYYSHYSSSAKHFWTLGCHQYLRKCVGWLRANAEHTCSTEMA